MNFWDFLSNNASGIAALFGVLLGAGGTYFVQSRMLKKQRELTLMDIRRDWKVKRFREMEEAIKKCTSHHFRIQLEGHSTEDTASLNRSNIAHAMVVFDETLDNELAILYDNWIIANQELVILIGEENELINEPVQNLRKITLDIQKRINELILETLNE